MSIQFRKSKQIGATKFTIGKNSESISLGTKGIRKTFNSNGKQTTSFGINGTGLSYRNSNTKNYSEHTSDYIENENIFFLLASFIWNLIKLFFYLVILILLIYIIFKIIFK